jgi:hypothetical protein
MTTLLLSVLPTAADDQRISFARPVLEPATLDSRLCHFEHIRKIRVDRHGHHTFNLLP